MTRQPVTPQQIVATIKEKPSAEGVRLLVTLFPNAFAVVNSAIDPKSAPRQAPPKPDPVKCPRCGTVTAVMGEHDVECRGCGHDLRQPYRPEYDPDHNPHPLDSVRHQADELPQFQKVRSVKPHEDLAGQGRSYDIMKMREGSGRIQKDGRDATREEIRDATDEMNRAAEVQLQQMRDGTYQPLDRNVSPDTTHPTFSRSNGPGKGSS